MHKLKSTRYSAVFALCAGLTAHSAFAQNNNEHWVATWATASQQAPALRLGPVGQPVTAAQQAQAGFNNQTIRMMAPISIGGRRVRLHLSNTYSTTALVVGAVHVAVHAKASAITPGSDHAVTFGGKPGFTIPPGASALSDAVDFDATPLSELAVSLYLPTTTGAPTMHTLGMHTTYISKTGDATAAVSLDDAATTQSSYWLSAIDVLAPASAGAIVTFGDSITDGSRSTVDANSSWPLRLARRLADNPATAHLAIANEGIAGNRILRDGAGASALARFDADVLSPAGVKWVVVLEGINDIGRGVGLNGNPNEAATADDLIGALRQMIERAHEHGIRVAGATITPFTGAAYFNEKGEAIRDAVNTWIRSGGAFDAVIDFEAAARDANNPKLIRAVFDSGDHLHPNDVGYQAMADSIDLRIFTAPASAATASR